MNHPALTNSRLRDLKYAAQDRANDHALPYAEREYHADVVILADEMIRFREALVELMKEDNT